MYSGRKVTGRLWRVTAETKYYNGTVGVMLMEEARGEKIRPGEHKPPGVVSTGMFHEHLGGTKCRSFEVQEERQGPFPVIPRSFTVDGETTSTATPSPSSTAPAPILAELRNMSAAYPCMVDDHLSEGQKACECECRAFDMAGLGPGRALISSGGDVSPGWNASERRLLYVCPWSSSGPPQGEGGCQPQLELGL